MIHRQFLQSIKLEQLSSGLKIFNKYCFSPFATDKNLILRELDSKRTFSLPTFHIEEENVEQVLEDVFVELLFESKRSSKCDVLNTNTKNLKSVIKRVLKELQTSLHSKIERIAIVGSDLKIVEEPIQQLLCDFNFVEFVENNIFKSQIILIPKDVKIGSLVSFSEEPTRFGMFIYEEYVKRLEFYSDADLQVVLNQLITDLETGEL